MYEDRSAKHLSQLTGAGIDCPGEYHNLASETKQLGDIIESFEYSIERRTIAARSQEELKEKITGCKDVLKDLEAVLSQYESLGSQQKRTWDRLRWDKERTKDIRARLTSNVTLLTAFRVGNIENIQSRIERALLQLLNDFQNGNKDSGSVSALTAVDEADDIVWPQVIRDLEDVGISAEVANQNRSSIVRWFVEARNEGALLELPPASASSTGTDASDRDRRSPDGGRPRSSTTQDTGPLGRVQSTPTPSGSLKYLGPFDQLGLDTSHDVIRNKITFRDDVNLARVYWDRSDWPAAKKRLLRLVVAAQLPSHRRSDLDARTAAFLLGIACSYSGDHETAMSVFRSVLESTASSHEEGLRRDVSQWQQSNDDARIAAASWLGDVCLKTNRLEDAAMSWAVAIDAARRRDVQDGRDRVRVNSVPSGRLGGNSASPPLARFQARNPSVPFTGHASSAVPRSSTRPSIHAQILSCELDFVNDQLHNLKALDESISSDLFPHTESIFTESTILSSIPMATLVRDALPAEGISLSNTPLVDNYDKEVNKGEDMLFVSRSKIVVKASSNAELGDVNDTRIVPAQDCLWPHSSHTAWPLPFDPRFSYAAAVRAIKWFDWFSPIPHEDAGYNVTSLDSKGSRKLGKPDHIAEGVNAKREIYKYVSMLRRMLVSLRIQYKEAPGEFRCRPMADRESGWSSVAVFALRLVKWKPEGLLSLGPKLVVYITKIIHWDGTIEERATLEASQSHRLLHAMSTKLKVYEAEERGQLSPGGPGPDVVMV